MKLSYLITDPSIDKDTSSMNLQDGGQGRRQKKYAVGILSISICPFLKRFDSPIV